MDNYTAIHILEFIQQQYEKDKQKRPGAKKYIDALELGITALQDKNKDLEL